MIATSTNDGGGDEQKASAQLVKEGNNIYCNAHNFQLVVGDPMDPKKAHPPPQCARARAVVLKMHNLVVCINGHRVVTQAFLALVKEKKNEVGANMWDTIPLDNDTRWDSELGLLERGVYFDGEILDLAAIV